MVSNMGWTLRLISISAFALLACLVPSCAGYVLGFFGQSPAVATSLRAMCDTGFFDMIAISFLSQYGYIPMRLEVDSYNCTVPVSTGTNVGTGGCAQISSDIGYCRGKNIKIMLAMGGCVDKSCGGDYTFQNAQQASKTATDVWNTFIFPNPTGVAGSPTRPFGSVPFDGVVLDVENNSGQIDQLHYDTFTNILLSYNKDLLIVGTPECRINSTDINPMETMVKTVPFDYLMIQFYNDNRCSLGQASFDSTLRTWMGIQNNATDRMNILIGAPGDAGAYAKNTGSNLWSGNQLGALVNKHRNDTVRNPVVGVGIWSSESDTGLLQALNSKLSVPWDTNAANRLEPTVLTILGLLAVSLHLFI